MAPVVEQAKRGGRASSPAPPKAAEKAKHPATLLGSEHKDAIKASKGAAAQPVSAKLANAKAPLWSRLVGFMPRVARNVMPVLVGLTVVLLVIFGGGLAAKNDLLTWEGIRGNPLHLMQVATSTMGDFMDSLSRVVGFARGSTEKLGDNKHHAIAVGGCLVALGGAVALLVLMRRRAAVKKAKVS